MAQDQMDIYGGQADPSRTHVDNFKIQPWQLDQRLAYPFELKIKFAKQRIREFYREVQGQIFVAFSGGKDSTVLLHLVRELYPDTPAVFVNTGLEYPEIVDFVKTIDNVTILRPKIPFPKVIKKYGFPVVSKEFAQAVYELTNYNLSEKIIQKYHKEKISKKHRYLLKAPFPISHKCCYVMKKSPMKSYMNKTGRYQITGLMAYESRQRRMGYLLYGCNILEGKNIRSRPLSIWVEEDIWKYIKDFQLAYSKIYDMGYDRTGCMFCMFGIHMDKCPNRFQKMSKTHPQIHNYCINKLGLKKVLDFMGIPYEFPKGLEYYVEG